MSSFEDVRSAFAGRYLLESEIGQGGSARVYAAQDLKHDRRVAIKILKPEIAQSIAADRFLREIRVDAGLQHPRILPLFDSGEVLGIPYFVMPFVDGATLRMRIQREGTLAVPEAVNIALQIADALQYLHARRLVHRDVKPENVLLQGDHAWLADFGIVRALQDAITGSMTVTGTAVGTPAYMSPEQRFGSPTVDERSDQFSLASVLYEMLTGRPPKVFDRMSVSPRSSGPRVTPARELRSGVSQALDDVLARALQMEPEARWPSMQHFADQLLEVTRWTPAERLTSTTPTWKRGRTAVASVGVLTLLAAAWFALKPPAPALDALRVAVLPLAHEGDQTGQLLDGDDCSRFLRDAIGRWTGIHHVDDMQLRDIRGRLGRPESFEDAMTMARRLGAGLAVWGIVGPAVAPSTSSSNSARSIRLFLYDVAKGEPREEAAGVVDPTSNLGETFQTLADSLLSGTSGARPIRVSGTRDFGAVRAYLDGHRALDTFDLEGATTAFQRAVDVDPSFGSAFLWLAWSTMWTPGSDSRDWGAAAARALAVGAGLTTRDSVHASALLRIQERQFAAACDLFRTLIERDSRDFAAWYGLGECLSSDYTVVSSATSPSGWQFRTSMHEAVRAYERAIDLVPSFNDAMGQRALQQLSRWQFARTGRYRPGLSEDSTKFAAWPSLAGDTLAFIPFHERAVFAESAGTRASTYAEALRRNGDRVLAMVNRWVSLDSANPVALETLALAREGNDELMALRRTEVGLRLTGFEAIRHARIRSSGEAAIRLAATETRFLIKVERYRDAKRLADSLLTAVRLDSASSATASWMHSLAMLTGRVGPAIAWGRRSATYQYRDPIHPEHSITATLSEAASDAATFASIGAPSDSIRSAVLRTERAMPTQRGPSVEVLRRLYVEQPLLYAWPALGDAVAPPTRASAGNRWLAIQLALARADTAGARSQMWQADSSSVRAGAAEIAFEIALLNSRIWLALHDTVSAARSVSTALDLSRISGEQLMRRPTATASFVRLLVQRATLADAQGDTTQSRAYGTRAWLLWRDADPMLANVLQPVLRWRDVPIPGGVR